MHWLGIWHDLCEVCDIGMIFFWPRDHTRFSACRGFDKRSGWSTKSPHSRGLSFPTKLQTFKKWKVSFATWVINFSHILLNENTDFCRQMPKDGRIFRFAGLLKRGRVSDPQNMHIQKSMSWLMIKNCIILPWRIIFTPETHDALSFHEETRRFLCCSSKLTCLGC